MLAGWWRPGSRSGLSLGQDAIAVILSPRTDRPFGVSDAYVQVRPRKALRRHADVFRLGTKVFGALYLAVGRTE